MQRIHLVTLILYKHKFRCVSNSCYLRTQQGCKLPVPGQDVPVGCPVIWSADMCHVPGLWFSVILGVGRKEHTQQVLAISY